MGVKVRVGIDVGGTFTKAIAIDNETHKIVGKTVTLTTHSAPEGVAKGVIQVFYDLLKNLGANPEDVNFIAHSTTQATNALLEGDVAPVGIVGIGKKGLEGFFVSKETNVRNIELAPGRTLITHHKFLNLTEFNNSSCKQAIEDLVSKGTKVIVASEAFGVDRETNELLVMKVANDLGVPVTGGHEISRLYGLTVRTRTAVINASILPRMIETSDMIKDSVRKTGIKAPLMIMRGDGGVMDIDELLRRPILTMLSGPAASVAGALMYLKVSDGIFFEVGGTSTNIGVIRNGKPIMKYAEVGGHRTYVNSLDVRVVGIAGGSMVRIRGKEVLDVGPRSAHIAGLTYSSFTTPDKIADPKVVLIKPKPGDPADYVAVETSKGERFAITNTCAANVLGFAKPGDYACGNPEAARRAIDALAQELNMTPEDVARKILQISSKKVMRVISKLIEEYKLSKDSILLVGGGGGAAALIPFVAETMKLNYKISENAEVISSIGVALAMVRDIVERIIVNPQPEDILMLKREATDAAVRSGALPETVEVHVEIDPHRNRVRATALGATELRTRDLLRKITVDEAKSIVAESTRTEPSNVNLLASTEAINVFEVKKEAKSMFISARKRLIVAVDQEGFIKLQQNDAQTVQSSVQRWAADFADLWEKTTNYHAEVVMNPNVFVLIGRRVLDLSGMRTIEQVKSIIETELQGLAADEPIVMMGVKT
jgi:N-methylhydantoinase A/oxoprolinase/acetone carboxylase beta subunit